MIETAPAAAPQFAFDNSYARDLPGTYVPWQPAPSPAPRLVKLNAALALELGLDPQALAAPDGLAVLAGNAVPDGAQPLAQAYAGHQFGGYSPQLGDGRALLLGEVIDRRGQRRDIAFKGSGRTPFSRGGDGRAALGPVLREYLVGEAMHALGIPTTRALAAVTTGETVRRDGPLPGAILTRVAASHLRVGTFQFFAAQQDDPGLLARLADHAIARHDPRLADQPGRHLGLLRAVVQRQAALVAQWMGVGFIHGVMNTDNTTISGETIDYGPCAFMEAYSPAAVFSSIDHQGRYRFGNQPGIAQWNLARLAEALLPLIDADHDRALDLASDAVSGFAPAYREAWLRVLQAKLGLAPLADQDDTDLALGEALLALLHAHQVDFTLGWRRLPEPTVWQALFSPDAQAPAAEWHRRWQARRALGADDAAMARANPLYIARNHLVEAALDAAVQRDDQGPFECLLAVLQRPFDERPDDAAFAQPAPAEVTAAYMTYCGT